MNALIMLPYAGSLGYTYDKYTSYFEKEFKVYSIDYSGRGKRSEDPYVTGWIEFIRDIANQIEEIVLKQDKYVLFGHSMGAYALYDVYYELMDRECPQPNYVIFSGIKALHNFKPIEFVNETDFRRYYKEMGGISDEVLACDELADYVFEIIKQDVSLLNQFRYRNRSPIHCPILVLNGVKEMKSSIKEWLDYTNAYCHYQIFPGGHFFINSSIDEVSRLIRDKCV